MLPVKSLIFIGIAAVVSDQDGENEYKIMERSDPIMSPAWSPDSRQIAFVSQPKKSYATEVWILRDDGTVQSFALKKVRSLQIKNRTLEVGLRKALGAKGHDRFIQTVRGAGYRFSTRD